MQDYKFQIKTVQLFSYLHARIAFFEVFYAPLAEHSVFQGCGCRHCF